MIRAYLDHKDFVSMAQGRRGKAQYASYARSYDKLLEHVQNKRLTCFFSAIHLLEAVRYEGFDAQALDDYCDVVDNLTQRRSIVWMQTLQDRELQFFVHEHFRVPYDISRESFPYGSYLEAYPGFWDGIETWTTQLRRDFERSAKKALSSSGGTRIQRRQARKMLPPLSSIECTPDLLESIPFELRNLFTPQIVTELFRATSSLNKNAMRSVLERLLTFKQILSVWKAICPDVLSIGRVFDQSGQEIIDMIKYHRQGVEVLKGRGAYRQVIDAGRASIVATLAKQMSGKVTRLMPHTRVSKREVERALIESDMKALPSWDVAISLYHEYVLRNVTAGHRTVKGSDLRDILHLTCMPYVNFLVTDRYFSDLASGIARRFSTTVLRNVDELVLALEAKF